MNIRKIWPHEAHDFTPWLADNLHMLGDTLGMRLELDRREAQVGPYSLDILAKETERGVTVAIENQLEWTDFQHLAQILIYSAGSDARISIWVAPEFRYESAQVLNWLNEWTRDGLDFYGVRFKVGDSADETTFHKVVYPGGWNKDLTLPLEPPMSPPVKQHYDFFQPLITELLGEGFADKANQYLNHTGRLFPSSFDGIGYAASFWKSAAWVTLHIQMDDNEQTKQTFDALREQQDQIEKCLQADWHWLRHDSITFSTANIRRDGSIDDPEKLEEIRAWMLKYLPKLKEILDPHLERVLKELQPEGAGDAEV